MSSRTLPEPIAEETSAVGALTAASAHGAEPGTPSLQKPQPRALGAGLLRTLPRREQHTQHLRAPAPCPGPAPGQPPPRSLCPARPRGCPTCSAGAALLLRPLARRLPRFVAVDAALGAVPAPRAAPAERAAHGPSPRHSRHGHGRAAPAAATAPSTATAPGPAPAPAPGAAPAAGALRGSCSAERTQTACDVLGSSEAIPSAVPSSGLLSTR